MKQLKVKFRKINKLQTTLMGIIHFNHGDCFKALLTSFVNVSNVCWTFGNNSELQFKLRHLISPTPSPADPSYQTLLPKQKTLIVCWHVDLPKEKKKLKSHQ